LITLLKRLVAERIERELHELVTWSQNDNRNRQSFEEISEQ